MVLKGTKGGGEFSAPFSSFIDGMPATAGLEQVQSRIKRVLRKVTGVQAGMASGDQENPVSIMA